MFRGRGQVAEVCRMLTKDIAPGELWTRNGPSAEARKLFADNSGKMRGTHRTMLHIAFWLWGEGERGPNFGNAVELLDRTNLRRVGSLLTAMADGADAIDRWIRSNGGFVGDA